MNMESQIDKICKKTLMFPIFVPLFHNIHAFTTINATDPQYHTVVSQTDSSLTL